MNKSSTEDSGSDPCTPQPVKMFCPNILRYSFNNFNFNGANFSQYNFGSQNYKKKNDFLTNCTFKEIQQDFQFYKKRSDELEVRDEICQILSNHTIYTPKLKRPKNPFWKNF